MQPMPPGPVQRAPPRPVGLVVTEANELQALVAELVRAAADLHTPEKKLEQLFHRVKHLRRSVAGAGPLRSKAPLPLGAVAGPAAAPALGWEGTAEEQKDLLLRALVDHLEKKGGTDSISNLGSLPAVLSHRKGVVSSLSRFLRDFPEIIEVSSVPNQVEGKPDIQVAKLLRPAAAAAGLAKRKREEASEEDRREALLQRLAEALAAAGGSCALPELLREPAVQKAASAVPGKLHKFISEYPEVFELTSGASAPHQVCVLLVEASAAVAAGNVREKMALKVKTQRTNEGGSDVGAARSMSQEQLEAQTLTLLQEIEAVAMSHGGEVTLSLLGESPSIVSLRKGVAANLKKFLLRYPQKFQVLEPLAGDASGMRLRLL